jgi:hypothetical protein
MPAATLAGEGDSVGSISLTKATQRRRLGLRVFLVLCHATRDPPPVT